MRNEDIFSFYVIAACVAIVSLIIAIDGQQIGYYTYLRIVVSTTSLTGCYLAYKLARRGWMGIYFVIAILFNPIILIHLPKRTWRGIDAVVMLLFVLSFWNLPPKEESSKISAEEFAARTKKIPESVRKEILNSIRKEKS